ncbi:MAG TPA: hemolysin family protein [Thermodesulfobacteriota bacterium]|nr:hemolysin family protein [Thermodesulfobacteriota bacterium]
MEPFILIRVFFVALLLFLSAFFSGSEVALFSLGQLRLQQMKEKKQPSSRIVEKLLGQPRRLLISILAGNEIVNISLSALATPLFISSLGEGGKLIAIFTMTFLILFLGEIIPKSLAIAYPDSVSSVIARPMMRFVQIITPVRWAIKHVVDAITSLLRIKRDPRENIFMEAEFKDLVDLGHRDGSIEGTERELIHRVFRLGDTRVARIMTPKEQMFALPLEIGFGKLIAQVKEGHYSRIPIYSRDRDNIVGILNAKDLLPFVTSTGDKKLNLTEVLRKPLFVPENKRIDELLRELQQKKIHMAIVVREDGRVVGLVTMEDILEEIFGEIYDEYDR